MQSPVILVLRDRMIIGGIFARPIVFLGAEPMIDPRKSNGLLLTVALALTTIGSNELFSQEHRPSPERRIVVLDDREAVEGEVIVRYRSRSEERRVGKGCSWWCVVGV